MALLEIGVGYDGSTESTNAFAREPAGEFGAKVSVFEAVSLPIDGLLGTGEAIGELVNAVRAWIASLVNVEPHAAYPVAEEISLYAAPADVLIVG